MTDKTRTILLRGVLGYGLVIFCGMTIARKLGLLGAPQEISMRYLVTAFPVLMVTGVIVGWLAWKRKQKQAA